MQNIRGSELPKCEPRPPPGLRRLKVEVCGWHIKKRLFLVPTLNRDMTQSNGFTCINTCWQRLVTKTMLGLSSGSNHIIVNNNPHQKVIWWRVRCYMSPNKHLYHWLTIIHLSISLYHPFSNWGPLLDKILVTNFCKRWLGHVSTCRPSWSKPLHRIWYLMSHTLFENGLKLMPRGLRVSCALIANLIL